MRPIPILRNYYPGNRRGATYIPAHVRNPWEPSKARRQAPAQTVGPLNERERSLEWVRKRVPADTRAIGQRREERNNIFHLLSGKFERMNQGVLGRIVHPSAVIEVQN